MSQLISALKKAILNPIVLLSLTITLGAISAGLLADAPSTGARAERAERLQPLSAAALADAKAGDAVLLEGTVSEANPTVYRSFAAYVHEEYRSPLEPTTGDSSARWIEDERVTPPLLITVAGGDVRLANSDYAIDAATTVREAEPTLTDGAVQSRGFGPGDPVLVLGTVDAAGGAVRAELLYGGTRAAYIAEMRRLAGDLVPIGMVFAGLAVVAGAAFIWQGRLFLRELAAERAADGGAARRR